LPGHLKKRNKSCVFEICKKRKIRILEHCRWLLMLKITYKFANIDD